MEAVHPIPAASAVAAFDPIAATRWSGYAPRMHRSFMAGLLALALTGCSYHYDLKALELNGRHRLRPGEGKGYRLFRRL